MLHIILAILKIIGITLAAVLLLLLLLFLLLMFVPLRYELHGRRYPKVLEGRVRISWLLHAISLKAEFKEGSLMAVLGICGFKKQIFPPIEKLPKKIRKKKRQKTKPQEELEDSGQADPVLELPVPAQEGSIEIEEGKSGPALEEQTEDFDEPKEEMEMEPEGSSGFIRKIIRKIRGFWYKLYQSLQKAIRMFRELFQKGGMAKEKFKSFIKLLKSDLTRVLFGRYKGFLLYLLKHIKPRKIKGSLRFGFGDPSFTGQAAGLLYLLLPANFAGVDILPDFHHTVLEGELSVKGHIRACHLARIGWKVFRDKELRRFIKKWKA